MDTPSCSWTIKAKMPIWAARPWFNSIARFFSWVPESSLSQPKSRAPLRKSPRNSPPVMSFMTKISRKPMKARIWARPAEGMADKAAQPLGMEAKLVPDKSMSPGRRMPASWTKYPTTASMEMRPCLSST